MKHSLILFVQIIQNMICILPLSLSKIDCIAWMPIHFSDYFNEYVNYYLNLSTYLTDVTVNLNNNCKCKSFIRNLCQGRDFLHTTYDKLHSNDPTKWATYKQGNPVCTLESVAKGICPSQHIPHHISPIPKRELTFNCQQPPQQKPPPLPIGTPASKKV